MAEHEELFAGQPTDDSEIVLMLARILVKQGNSNWRVFRWGITILILLGKQTIQPTPQAKGPFQRAMQSNRVIAALYLSLALTCVSATAATESEQLVILRLTNGIEIGMPSDWRTDSSIANRLVKEAGQDPVDLSTLVPDSGHVIIVASPLHGFGEGSAEISIMPTGVSQSQVKGMAMSVMPSVDRQMRQEIESSAQKSGYKILSWRGTSKENLGSKVALVSRYRYRSSDQKQLNVESYGIYLGSHAVYIRFQYTDEDASILKESLERIKASVRIH